MTEEQIDKFAEESANNRYYKDHPKYWAFIEGVKSGAAFMQPLVNALRAELELQNKEIELLEERYKAGAESGQPQIEKLQAFKDFVHRRLDEMGVPHHPDGEHSKAGCRIGDRLDIVEALMDSAEAQPEWRYLPELPERGDLVTVAWLDHEGTPNTANASCTDGIWYNDRRYPIRMQDSIYAWTIKPTPPLPPVKNQ